MLRLSTSSNLPLLGGLFWLLCDLTRFLNGQNVQPRPFGANGRFEYKHSFRAPHLAHKDGTISFWTPSGDAIPSSDQVTLTVSMRSKAGSVWNTKPMSEAEFWTVEMSLKVSGLGTLGADGLAFWYTDSIGQRGSVFGSSDKWNGLGIFFDSYANDNKNNVAPFIGLMINDGTREYDQNRDGGDQILAKCVKDFRNQPHPVKARIEYLQNVVSVYIHNGKTPLPQYELCLRAENILLPKNGYFGLSAATGGLFDDHDVTSFEVWSYSPVPTRQAKSATLPVEEKKKIDDEYERQRAEYDQAREKFQKEHPEIVATIQETENPIQRGIRQMLEMQTSTYVFCQQLDAKLAQLNMMQQNIMQLIGQQGSQKQPEQPSQPGVPQNVPADSSSLHRNEAIEILQASREIASVIKDIKSYVVDVQGRVMLVDQRLTSAASGGHQVPAESDADFTKSYLEAIKREVDQIRLHQRTQTITCPTLNSSCLNSTLFLLVILVQTTVFLIYMMFKGRSEKAKFY